MNEANDIPEELRDLIDDYISGTIDADGMRKLEARLLADADARGYFVRYCRLHADLDLDARARQAGERALQTIDQSENATNVNRTRMARWGVSLAAAVFLLAASSWIVWSVIRESREELAWLINAQNCQWAENMAPEGNMQAGKVLRLERGLAEVRFQKGARIVMEGPASLEIISANSARPSIAN